MEKQDMTIICRNCGKEFIFTEGEQKFYEGKGLSTPVRCKECRNKRKMENETKIEEQKKDCFEDMLKKFQENTIVIDKKDRR